MVKTRRPKGISRKSQLTVAGGQNRVISRTLGHTDRELERLRDQQRKTAAISALSTRNRRALQGVDGEGMELTEGENLGGDRLLEMHGFDDEGDSEVGQWIDEDPKYIHDLKTMLNEGLGLR